MRPEVNLTPLIDTALTLLIIFMVATPIIKHENALQVELPKGKVKEVDLQKEKLKLVVDSAGALTFNDTPCTQQEVVDLIRNTLKDGQEETVSVKADTAVSYGKVIELIDSIKQIEGVKYVALATREVVT